MKRLVLILLVMVLAVFGVFAQKSFDDTTDEDLPQGWPELDLFGVVLDQYESGYDYQSFVFEDYESSKVILLGTVSELGGPYDFDIGTTWGVVMYTLGWNGFCDDFQGGMTFIYFKGRRPRI